MDYDARHALEQTLHRKQEMVRDYQLIADHLEDEAAVKLFKHFAEAEMLHATQIREKLNSLS